MYRSTRFFFVAFAVCLALALSSNLVRRTQAQRETVRPDKQVSSSTVPPTDPGDSPLWSTLANASYLKISGGQRTNSSGNRLQAACATYTVDSLLDATDAAPGNGVCAISGGGCTLRAAIAEGNANACVGTRDITFSVTGTITLGNLPNNFLSPFRNTNIIGPGANNLTIDGGLNTTTRVFFMTSGTHTISGVTIQGGNIQGVSAPDGGGIVARTGSNLALDSVIIRNNLAEFEGGAFLFENGTYSISNSAIYGNQANNCGVGIITFGGNLTITNTTISQNFAAVRGGALCSYGTGTQLIIRKSTITGNSTGVGGGGIHCYVASRVTLGNSIVAGNTTATNQRIDIWNEGGGGAAGPFTDEGYNIIGKMDGANENSPVFTAGTPSTNNNYVGTAASPVDPRIGPLANNGGPTPTHALLAGSYAVDKGKLVAGATNDQRGLPRPYDNPLVAPAPGGDDSDIGAYEAQVTLIPPVISVTGGPLVFPDTPVTATSSELTYTVGGTDLFANLVVTAPNTNFEVSLTSGSGFGPSVSLTPVSGTVATTTIYVRFTPQTAGAKSGNVSNATTGGATQNVAVSGLGTTACSGITVNSLGDAPDSNPGNGACATAGGVCTLRAAIQESNVSACSGTPTINFSVTGNITPATVLPQITRAMTINGPGPATLTITAGHAFRVLDVNTSGEVKIKGMTLADGQSPTVMGPDPFLTGGGVIFRQRSGMIENCVIRNSSAVAGGGLAAGTSGTLTILNSTFAGNTSGGGGAVYAGSPTTAVIEGSTFNDNVSSAHGGAIHDSSSGGGSTWTVLNSTFSHNTANNNAMGGAVFVVTGTFQARYCTFTLNHAAQSGGAIYQGAPGILQVGTSVVAQNTAGLDGDDIGGFVNTLGGNVVGTNDGNNLVAGMPAPGPVEDWVGDDDNPLDAHLGPLASNGGPTQTHALLCGSIAIDLFNPAFPPDTDQRGVSRPQGAQVDAGAFEGVYNLSSNPPAVTTLFVGKPYSQPLSATGGTAPYMFTLAGGSLPAGITLSPAGVVSGAPTVAGIFPVNIQVDDAGFSTGCLSFTLTVINPAPLDFDADGITDYAVVRDGGTPAPSMSGPADTASDDQAGVEDPVRGGTLGALHRGRYFRLPGEKFDPMMPRIERANGVVIPMRWLVHTSGPGADINLLFGNLDDFPVPADYDGDGRADMAVWTGGPAAQFRVLTSSSGYTATVNYNLGNDACDPSIVGDYDGDGRVDPAVFNVNTGQWQYLGGPTHATLVTVTPVGTVGGVFPIQGDFDGDGKYDFTMVARDGLNPTSGHFYQWLNNGTATPPATTNFVFGNYRDVVVPGDYDGDGTTDIALASVIVNPMAWRVRLSPVGTLVGPISFGDPNTDYTLTGDYDGNRKGEFTLWHSPGVFQSLMGPTFGTPSVDITWGQSGDYPVAYFNSH